MKTWEEMTKLETKTKIMITFHIIMAIFSIITTIVNKESTWILVALLWINVAIMEYCDGKLLKSKDALIELHEEHTKIQDKMIINLLKDLSTPNVVIDINLIKIPKKFTKPRKEKLDKII